MFNFDATNVEPSSDYDLLPNGEYTAMIKEATIKPTKAGTGRYINLQLEILDGKYQGRVVFVLINFENPNPVAQDIGQKTLSAICHAVNQLQLSDPSELCNKPMTIKLGIQKDAEYGDKNKVKSYKATGGSTAAPATQQTNNAGAAPWA